MSSRKRLTRNLFLITALIAAVVVSLFRVMPTFAAKQSIGASPVNGTLTVSVEDSGRMNVQRYAGGVWQDQVFNGTDKGSTLWINGTPYNMGYYSGTPVTLVSNTTVGNTITTVVTAGSTRITQITSYIPGNTYYRLNWQITNTGGTSLSDIRFFHGQDTFLQGTDTGAGWWEINNKIIGVRKVVSGLEQRMSLQGITTPYGHESADFGIVANDASLGALTNVVDPLDTTDNGYALEWRQATLAAGATWTIDALEKFTSGASGALMVIAPVATDCAVGVACNLTYTINNTGLSSVTSPLTINSTQSWGQAIISPSSPVTLAAGASVNVVVRLTVPNGTATGTQGQFTLTGNDGTSNSSDIASVNVLVSPLPAAPVLTAPAAGAIVTVFKPAFRGTSDAGATVTVTDADSSVVICTALVSADGTWSCTATSNLSNAPSHLPVLIHIDVTATNTFGSGPATSRNITVQEDPAADEDGDSLPNFIEETYLTDPVNPASPVAVNPTADDDGDGVTNAWESILGTNPADADSNSTKTPAVDENNNGTSDANEDFDGDGIPNLIEIRNGTDPLSPTSPVAVNPTADDDGDGVTNAWESILGTNPADADSNSTKTPVVDENNNGTSDANEDFDGDGIPNLIEIHNGTDPLSPTSPVAANPTGDDDGDGVTNAWERILGTDPANPDSNSTKTTPNEAGNGTSDANEDFDGDGVTNVQEIAHGTDPLSPTSPVAVNPTADDDGDGVINAWESILGTNPANPDSDSTKTTPNEAGNGTSDANEDFDGDGIPNLAEIRNGTDPLSLTSPVAVNPIADDDGDGVTNVWESILGTDPTNPDSNSTKTTPNEAGNGTSDANEDFDGDGIPTAIEIAYGTDPLSPTSPVAVNPTADDDGDGVTNAWESILGTDPAVPDSNSTKTTPNEAGNGTNDANEDFDGDGLPNAQEIAHGTDPLNPASPTTDSDGDGVTNAWESTLGTDPANPDSNSTKTTPNEAGNGTNDANEDFDGDGVTNVQEIATGSDPLNPNDPSKIDLEVTQTSNLTGLGNLTMTITVRNKGTNPLTGAKLIDTFPDASTIWSWTCVGTACSAASGTGNLNETLGTLPMNGTAVYTVTGSVINWSSWSNTATIAAPLGIYDNISTNNSATVGRYQILLMVVIVTR